MDNWKTNFYLDGELIPGDAQTAAAGNPAVLAGCSVNWGRDNTTEQPKAASMSATIGLGTHARQWAEKLKVGKPVRLTTSGEIIETTPTPPLPFTPGTYETTPQGLTPTPDGTFSAPREIAATLYPGNPDATLGEWDNLPTFQNKPWKWTLETTAPVGSKINVSVFTSPRPAGPWKVHSEKETQTTTPSATLTGVISDAPQGNYITLAFSVTQPLPAWKDEPGAWTDHPEAWNVDIKQVTAKATLIQGGLGRWRTVEVFNGRVTQIDIKPDKRFTAVAVISAGDWLAAAANTIIGIPPRPGETATARLDAYIQAANLGISTTWDEGITATLAGRDVDAQALDSLITDIAVSCDAVAWPATHATTGPYLRLENMGNRAAARGLNLVNGTAVIGEASSGQTILPAPAIEKAPVKFTRNPAALTTQVSVRWIEETTNANGELEKTDRTEKLTNPELEKLYGRRSISVSTELNSQAQAKALAERLVKRIIGETWQISGLTWRGSAGPASITLDLLDGTRRNGAPYRIEPMEEWTPKKSMAVFIEGGTYRWDGLEWTLDLSASTPPPGSGKSAAWQDPPPAYTWTVFNTLTWQDMQGTQINQ